MFLNVVLRVWLSLASGEERTYALFMVCVSRDTKECSVVICEISVVGGMGLALLSCCVGVVELGEQRGYGLYCGVTTVTCTRCRFTSLVRKCMLGLVVMAEVMDVAV